MAVTSGTVWSVHTVPGKSDAVTNYQVAEILFTMSGTYAQADNSILTGIATLIGNSRRNGKTITLVDTMRGQPASKVSDETAIMSTKTVAISTNDITFELTDTDYTTEYADATAIVAQSRPFSILVGFTEA